MVKTLKNLLLQNQEGFKAESWTSWTQGLPSCSNDDPRLTFDLFTGQGQICISMHLYGENVEKSFSQKVLKTNGRNLQ